MKICALRGRRKHVITPKTLELPGLKCELWIPRRFRVRTLSVKEHVPSKTFGPPHLNPGSAIEKIVSITILALKVKGSNFVIMVHFLWAFVFSYFFP